MPQRKTTPPTPTQLSLFSHGGRGADIQAARNLPDAPSIREDTESSSETLVVGAGVRLRLFCGHKIVRLEGRVIAERETHMVIAAGGTILAFSKDGKKCLTEGFGPLSQVTGQ